MRHARVIQHVSFEDLGSLEQALIGAGYRIEYLDAVISDLSMPYIAESDLLVILGGPLSANDSEEFPFIRNELEILSYRRKHRLATLGICLGAQLMATALGGKVSQGKEPEIGWSPLQLTPEGERSALSSLDPSLTSVFHWHGETFSLPEGATLLASTPMCRNQAFSWGSNWLALQFHPEVVPMKLEHWYVGHIHELNALKKNVFALREESHRRGPTLIRQADQVWSTWLRMISTRNTESPL